MTKTELVLVALMVIVLVVSSASIAYFQSRFAALESRIADLESGIRGLKSGIEGLESLIKGIPKPAEVAPKPPKKIIEIPIGAAPTSSIPFIVARELGFDEEYGIKFVPHVMGYAEEEKFFMAHQAPIGIASPWEAADMVASGMPVVFLSNDGAIRFFNGLFVRAEDYPKPYSSPKDLIGKAVGNPGWGSATTQAYEVLLKAVYGIDMKKDFENKIAESAALIPALDKGEVEAAILFSGHTLSALASGKYKMLANPADIWEKKTGQPLTVTGLVAWKDWLEKNPEVAKAITAALRKAVDWMRAHPEEFVKEGGKFYSNAKLAGWTRNEATKKLVGRWLAEGKYFIYGYTQKWIDANYEFIKLMYEAGILKKLPPKDAIFAPPSG